jgi:hypothetical protein
MRNAYANRKMRLDTELAAEAKSIVALAFLRTFMSEGSCPICAGKSEYLHIIQVEMKNIMTRAVDTVYKLLWLKQNDSEKYDAMIDLGNRYTQSWGRAESGR